MTYTYKCENCNNIFNIEKGINENVEIKCPLCDSKDITRKFSTPNFQIKMNGFCGKIGK